MNDDASTDGTAAIIREYAEKYPDIVRPFYQEKNLYSQDIDIYYAVFFPNARGKYVAFCEGDDYWTDPTKLQRQVDFSRSAPGVFRLRPQHAPALLHRQPPGRRARAARRGLRC